MKNLFTYLKKYKKNLVFGPIFKLLEAIIEITLPIIMAYLIDNYNEFSNTQLVYYLFFLLVLVIIGFTFAGIAQYIAAKTSQGYSKDLRKSLCTALSSTVARISVPGWRGDTDECRISESPVDEALTFAPNTIYLLLNNSGDSSGCCPDFIRS